MKSRSATSLAALVLLATIVPIAKAQDQPDHHNTQYRVFNLGIPLGGTVSAANGVNDLGVGISDTDTSQDAQLQQQIARPHDRPSNEMGPKRHEGHVTNDVARRLHLPAINLDRVTHGLKCLERNARRQHDR